jgi:hypothetical protein
MGYPVDWRFLELAVVEHRRSINLLLLCPRIRTRHSRLPTQLLARLLSRPPPRIDTRPPRAASQVAARALTEYYAQRGPSLSSSTHPSTPPGPQTGPIAPWDLARYTAIPGSSRTPISTGPPNHTSSNLQPQDAQTAPRDLAQTPTPLDHSSRSFIPLGPTLRSYSPP